MASKPKAKGKGRSPRTRGGSSGASRAAMKRASESRSRLKGRIRTLEAHMATLRALVLDIRFLVTGEEMWVHEDDLEGNQEEE